MELIAFEEQHYPLLINWIDNAELNFLWGGPCYRFPLTHKQIRQHCAQKDVQPYVLMDGGEPVGFVELFILQAQSCRICRVFVSPDKRGQGYSSSMLTLVMDKAREQYNCLNASLAVFTHNETALHCYRSLGFETYALERGTRYLNGRWWDLLLMSKTLS